MTMRSTSQLSAALRKLEVFHIRDSLLMRGLAVDEVTLNEMDDYITGRVDRDTVARALVAFVARCDASELVDSH